MSGIPLVQDNEKDSINTSIIAIKRALERINQLLGLSGSGTTVINNESNSGIPLGTWASFENDSAPNGEWIESGTTFDANTYPALAMMLGGNTVPQRFDKNRPAPLEAIVISTDSSSPTEMQYDGVIYIRYTARGSTPSKYYLNGVEVITFEGGYSHAASGVTFVVKKGDAVYCTLSGATPLCNASFYKHPLFIKATPTSSD